jgi:hypothetical protein
LGVVGLKRLLSIAMVLLVLSLLATPVFAARKMIPLGGKYYLQVRGVDNPHGIKSFGSWPGYDSFVHSNCYHVHGEFKKLNSSGRELFSKGVSIPVYCKGATKFIKKAFTQAAEKLKLSPWKFLKVGGVLVTIIMEIPSVGGPTQICNQNETTNSTSCYWQEY